jgi:hypothetical protein
MYAFLIQYHPISKNLLYKILHIKPAELDKTLHTDFRDHIAYYECPPEYPACEAALPGVS